VRVLERNWLQLAGAAHRTGGAAHWEFLPSVILNGRGALGAHYTLGSWHGAYSPKPEIVSNFTKLLIPCVNLPGRPFFLMLHQFLC